MALSVSECVELAKAMRSLGVLAFEHGDFKVSFGPPPQVDLEDLEVPDAEEDLEELLYISSPKQRHGRVPT